MHHSHFLSDYEILGFLGQGSYGKVVKVKSRTTGNILAAKIISLEGLSPNELKRTHEEQRIHSSLRHLNIISVFDTYLQQNQLVIVMEYCQYGDLHYYIKKKAHEGEHFEEGVIMNLFIQMLLGLQYLHQNKIVHRDIKPSNIFVDSEGIVKLADFGLSKALNQSHSASTFKIEAMVAPEICANQPPSLEADIWALGCVLFELCSLKPPFIATNILALATMIAQSEVPNLDVRYCDDLNALVRWMLDKNLKNRPAASQILRLSFVQTHSTSLQGRQGIKQQVLDPEIPHQFPIIEHKASIEEEDQNEYYQKLHQSCVQHLGSEREFQQMYNEIKEIKKGFVIINEKDRPKINNKLLQIYGEEYLDIAKGVAELVDHSFK